MLDGWLKKNVVYVNNEIPFSLKKEWSPIIYNNIDEPGRCVILWTKSGTDRQTPHDHTARSEGNRRYRPKDTKSQEESIVWDSLHDLVDLVNNHLCFKIAKKVNFKCSQHNSVLGDGYTS